MAESVASLVERLCERLLERANDPKECGVLCPEWHGRDRVDKWCGSCVIREVVALLREREAASRLSSPEGASSAPAATPLDKALKRIGDIIGDLLEHAAASPRVSAATPAPFEHRLEVTASYVLGGWSKTTDNEQELLLAIEEGRRLSPVAEVSVRQYYTPEEREAFRKKERRYEEMLGVSAATPAPAIDAKCLRCNNDLGFDPDCDSCRRYCELQASAAERPAPTCATCKHDTDYAECKANWRRPIVGVYWKRDNGCTLHEPGPVAKENKS